MQHLPKNKLTDKNPIEVTLLVLVKNNDCCKKQKISYHPA